MTELERFVAEMPAAIANQQRGADEERALIVSWLRKEAGQSDGNSAMVLRCYASCIEDGDHESDD